MAKLDELKEEIGWLKVIFGILIAVNISLLGWLSQNYNSAELILLAFTLVLVIFSTVGIIVVNKKAYKKMKEIRDI